MIFDEILEQLIVLLQRQKRMAYGALKRRFDLDDAYLEDLKDELIYTRQVAVDEDNRVLVWTDTSPPYLRLCLSLRSRRGHMTIRHRSSRSRLSVGN